MSPRYRDVLDYDIGLTNLVDRTSPGQDDLTKDEMRAGAEVLRAKLLHFRPGVVCFNGMGIYQAFIGSNKRVTPGLQPETLEEMLLYVVPSSSGRTAHASSKSSFSPYSCVRRLRLPGVGCSAAGSTASTAFRSPPAPSRHPLQKTRSSSSHTTWSPSPATPTQEDGFQPFAGMRPDGRLRRKR